MDGRIKSGNDEKGNPFSRRVFASELCHAIAKNPVARMSAAKSGNDCSARIPLPGFAALTRATNYERNKRKRNAGRRVSPILRAPSLPPPLAGEVGRGRGSRSAERARLSAFHHGSCCSERTPQLNSSTRFLGPGVIRCYLHLRLSQSSELPRRPVIVPAGRLTPEPPGNGLQIRPRAPHSLHGPVCLRALSLTSEIRGLCNQYSDICQE